MGSRTMPGGDQCIQIHLSNRVPSFMQYVAKQPNPQPIHRPTMGADKQAEHAQATHAHQHCTSFLSSEGHQTQSRGIHSTATTHDSPGPAQLHLCHNIFLLILQAKPSTSQCCRRPQPCSNSIMSAHGAHNTHRHTGAGSSRHHYSTNCWQKSSRYQKAQPHRHRPVHKCQLCAIGRISALSGMTTL